MAQRLVAIANVTGKAARYSSTEYSQDACNVPNDAITHTGGADDDYVKIADCSDQSYFEAHHCTIAATDGSWTVTIWNDDNNGHQFYWSPGNFYSLQNPVPASKDWVEVSLVISPGPVVHCAQWT